MKVPCLGDVYTTTHPKFFEDSIEGVKGSKAIEAVKGESLVHLRACLEDESPTWNGKRIQGLLLLFAATLDTDCRAQGRLR